MDTDFEPWELKHMRNHPNDAVDLAEMPGSIDPLPALGPWKTRTGLVIGGAFIPPKRPEYAQPVSYSRTRSKARLFFARFAAWLLR